METYTQFGDSRQNLQRVRLEVYKALLTNVKKTISQLKFHCFNYLITKILIKSTILQNGIQYIMAVN